jgi:hypothetical protein
LSLILSGLVILVSFLYEDQSVTNGLILGSFVSILFFLLAWWSISIFIREKERKAANPFSMLLAISIFTVKFPLLGIGLWYAFKLFPINVFALIVGIGITQVAILIAGLRNLYIN